MLQDLVELRLFCRVNGIAWMDESFFAELLDGSSPASAAAAAAAAVQGP